MVLTNGKVFILNTKDLSYVFHVDETGLLLHDYFGQHIEIENYDIKAISQKNTILKGTATIYKEEVNPNLSMDFALTEFSFPHKGDYKSTPILLKNKENGYVFDFNYEGYEMNAEFKNESELPTPRDPDEELVIHLREKHSNVRVDIRFLVFTESNVIARNMTIVNEGEADLEVLKALSLQLDMFNNHYEVTHFTGGWASEMHEDTLPIQPGRIVHESRTGFSSQKDNPLFVIRNSNSSLDYGEVMIFNLMYSGNHINEIELNTYGILRVMSGISPFCFNYQLKKGESFETPYAVFTYSNKGVNGARHNMHNFVNNHVVNPEFKEVVRPVVINNWEATNFKFNESRAVKIAKSAHKYGAELFVLDDGWFSTRNSDTEGLGDYDVNKKKLPHGLSGLAKKINKLGMKFGLWFEPEAVNPKSKLYKAHPEWAIKNVSSEPSLGRHELLLDLSKREVQDYIIENVSNILSNANIEYVKWDMNRHMSDIPSNEYVGEFFHRYILGLYRVMDILMKKFPKVLFEGCGSGGNRFDLGILYYFPQIWASDDTDAFERLRMQYNYSYGYPLSTISNHVSSTPNQQSLREIPINTRFNVAMFGVFGYELVFKELNKTEKLRAKQLIEVYKSHREMFQFGEFTALESNDNSFRWQVVSKDKKHAVLGIYYILQEINPKDTFITVKGLKEGKYSISGLGLEHDIREFGSSVNMITPFYVNPKGAIVALASHFIKMPADKDDYLVHSSELESNGIKLNPQWSASGINENVRVMRDFSSRLYLIDYIEENKPSLEEKVDPEPEQPEEIKTDLEPEIEQ